MKFSINDPNQDCIVFYDGNKQSPVLKVSQIQTFKDYISDSKINKIRLISTGNDSVIMNNCFMGLNWEDIKTIEFSNDIVSTMESNTSPSMSFIESFNITKFDPTIKQINSKNFIYIDRVKERLKDSDRIMNLFGSNVESWEIGGERKYIYDTDDLNWVLNNLSTGLNNNIFRMLLVAWINFIEEKVKLIKQDFWNEFKNQNKKITTEINLNNNISGAESFTITETIQLIINIVNTYNDLSDLNLTDLEKSVFYTVGSILKQKYDKSFNLIIDNLVNINFEKSKTAIDLIRTKILNYPKTLNCFAIDEMILPSPTNLSDITYKNFCSNIFTKLDKIKNICEEFEKLCDYESYQKFNDIKFEPYYHVGCAKIKEFNGSENITFYNSVSAQNIIKYLEISNNLIYNKYDIDKGDLFNYYKYNNLYDKALERLTNVQDNPEEYLKTKIKAETLSTYYNDFNSYIKQISNLSTQYGYNNDLSNAIIIKLFNNENLFLDIFQNGFKAEFDDFYCLLEIEEDFQKFLEGNYGTEKNNLLLQPKIYDVLLSIEKWKHIENIENVINFYNHVNFNIKYPDIEGNNDEITINIFEETNNLFSTSNPSYYKLFNFIVKNADILSQIKNLIKTYIIYEVQLFYSADNGFSIRYFLPVTDSERRQAIKSNIFNKFSLRTRYDKYTSIFNRKFILDNDYWDNAINTDKTIQDMLKSILEERNKIDYEELNLNSYNNLEGKSLQDLFEIQNKIKTYLANWNASESTDKTIIEFDTNINPSRNLEIKIQTDGILDLLNRIEQQRYIESNKILTDQETLEKINQEIEKIDVTIGNIAITGSYDDYIESFENALNVLQSSYYLKEKNPDNKYNVYKTYDQYLNEVENKINNYFNNYYSNAAVKTLYNKILAKNYNNTQTDLDNLNNDKSDFDSEYNRLMGLNAKYPNAGKYATIYINAINSATLNSTYIEIYNRITNALHEEELNSLEKQLEEERNKNNATENGED